MDTSAQLEAATSSDTSSAQVEVVTSSETSRRSRWLVLKDVLLNIELACAISSFSYGLRSLIITNLYIAKACLVNLNYSREICEDINHHDEENNEVERIVTKLRLYNTFLSSVPIILVSMVIGSWSDRNGRKPVLIIPLVGDIITQAAYILNVYFANARAEYLLFENLFALFGGYTTTSLGLYSYIADTTPPEARTSRISVMLVMSTAGWTCGNLLSPYLYGTYGYYGIFTATITLYIGEIIFIAVFIKESRISPSESSANTTPTSLKKLVSSAKDVVYSAVRPREGFQRCTILLLLTTMLLLNAAWEDYHMGYLFTRKMFAWEMKKYSQVAGLTTILYTSANMLLLPFLSYKLLVPDSVIGLMAALSFLAQSVVIALAQSGDIYIFARCLGILSGQAPIVIRSMLTKTVSSSELGKVFSLLGCLENLLPLGMSPLITKLYNNSLDVYPGAVYALASCILVLVTCCFLAIAVLAEKEQQYHDLHSQDQTEEEN